MKYLKSLGFIFIPIIVMGIILTILYYFDLLSTNILSYIKILLIIISFFIGGNYLGKNSKEKGWFQGLKLSGIIVFIFFCINFLAFDKGISLKTLIYYFILIITTTFGSMFGIRNIETKKK